MLFCLKSGFWLPWRATKGLYITSGEKFDQSPADNLQECMSRCLRYSANGKECRAVTITTNENKICELLGNRTGDAGVGSRPSTERQSFDRPTWYLGKKRIIYTPSWLHQKYFEWRNR